jgi:tetratricopeptide (TPR) repeat protein
VAERQEAEQIAELVGDLPLALGQAVAYLNVRRHVTVAEFARRLRQQPGRILATATGLPPSAAPVDRILCECITAVARENPLAARLLDAMAYLQSDRIAGWILDAGGPDEVAVDDALTTAASFSVVSRSVDAVAVHRLVQLVLRLGHTTAVPARSAVEMLLRCLPEGNPETDVASWPRWRELVPHILTIHDILVSDMPALADAGLEERASTLFAAGGLYLRGQGRYGTALNLLEHAAALAEHSTGPGSKVTLAGRYALAGGLWSAGRFQEALEVGSAVWQSRLRTLGPDHPDTLASASYVAIGYRELGRHEEALALSLATLQARARILGPDDPDTLQSGNNTAGCYRALGRHDEALSLYESVAADRRRTLGPAHFDTLQSLHNLAGGYLAVGRSRAALDLYRETLQTRQAVLGPQHPDTLHTQFNLAEAYRAVGRAEEAVTLMAEVLAVRQRLLGSAHPDTQRARDFLGSLG